MLPDHGVWPISLSKYTCLELGIQLSDYKSSSVAIFCTFRTVTGEQMFKRSTFKKVQNIRSGEIYNPITVSKGVGEKDRQDRGWCVRICVSVVRRRSLYIYYRMDAHKPRAEKPMRPIFEQPLYSVIYDTSRNILVFDNYYNTYSV